MLTTLSRLRAGILAGAAVFGLTALIPGLAAAQTCPNADLTGIAIDQSESALAAGQSFEVVAGGSVNLGACASLSGGGYVAEAPDFELTLSGSTGGDLQLSVAADCDTTVLVNDATATWQYSDDEDGTSNPRLRLVGAADGLYDIWVGTFGSATCAATLTIQTFAAETGITPPPPPAAQCPDFNIESVVMAYDFAQLATPVVQDVVAGGDLDLAGCPDVSEIGFVIQGPDYQLDLTGATGGDLELRLTADCDSILLVNDASGTWQYMDDSEGTLNPVLVLPAASDGAYDIWVGTIGPDTCPGTLQISAVGGGAPTTPGKGDPLPPPPTAAEPDPGNLNAYRTSVGQTLTFQVTGTTDGRVWGTDIYTDDSDLSTSAVHAGAIGVGQSGIVTVQVLGPQTAYQGGQRNGITASAYGSWGGSYTFVTN